MKSIFTTFVSLLVLLCSCSTPVKEEDKGNPDEDTSTTISTQIVADNSRTSLDWAGSYNGVLPCADCSGIETTLIIENDLSYRINRKYIGKSNKIFSEAGVFKWNEEGSKITLQSNAGEFIRYLVGENYLLQLDADGNKITGQLAENYLLNKQTLSEIPNDTPVEKKPQVTPQPEKKPQMSTSERKEEEKKDISDITGQKWTLIELNGKAVNKNNSQNQDVYFILNVSEKSISGFGGCNNFLGGYQMKEPTQIKFQKMISTMMACDNMENESELMNILDKVDNYTVSGNVLSLHKAKMAPLARFKRGQ